MEIETIEVSGWRGAIMALRMPYESHEKSDSIEYETGKYFVGANDFKLCKKLIKGGAEHRKFLRFINVQMGIKAPLYWWKHFDTYKVGTTASSSSTMHLLAKRLLHENDFEGMHGTEDLKYIASLNSIIARYSEEKLPEVKAQYELDLFARLPQGYLQKRIISTNYEVLYNIYNQRKGHKLPEWQEFREWCESLPHWLDFFIEG